MAPVYGEYVVSGGLVVGIWRFRAGAWEKFAEEYVQVYASTGNSSGRHQVGWSLQGSYQLGTDVTDIGVTIVSADDTADVNYLAVSYTQQQAGSERSATQNGGSTTAVVRP